jgi:hypothetical protein
VPDCCVGAGLGLGGWEGGGCGDEGEKGEDWGCEMDFGFEVILKIEDLFYVSWSFRGEI